jgi:AraC-like DNA-binding protein
MSPSRFAARFRMAMGQSVMSYVSQWRMNLACRLLREEDMGLADLAARVGYDDTAAFSRAFKSHLGSSPAQWRKLSRASGTTR